MPRHMIYGIPAAGQENADGRVEVGWAGGSEVQIAVTSRRTSAGGDDDEANWVGQSAELGRRQINDLIRALRRARDQAYGRDE